MATATKTRTEPAPSVPTEADSVVLPPRAETSYVVLSAAIVVRTGRKGNETARFLRGAIVPARAFANHPEGLERLVSLGAVALNDGQPKRALTPQAAALAAGQHVADPARPAIDQSAVDDATADGEQAIAPDIVHAEAEDEFEVRAR